MKNGNVTKTRFIIAGIDQGRERYLFSAKSTPKRTAVQWTDSKDEAYDFLSVDNARGALNHMSLPIPCCIVVRQLAN
jgi:hypothetical protein